MFDRPPRLTRPGLFVTATDTEVGKTVVTCAIAAALRRQGLRVGACKPFASGCRRQREGLISEDAEALAFFSDARHPLDIINPVRYRAPLAPAVAAALGESAEDLSAVARSLQTLDADSDMMLVEGVGGLMAPLLADRPQVTVLDLIASLGYPVVVVTRPVLGTLNHTAMTVKVLRDAGCRVAGLVLNGYEVDPSTAQPAASNASEAQERDLAMSTNPTWLTRMTRQPILATVPRCPADQVRPQEGRLPAALLEAVAMVDWTTLAKAPQVEHRR